MRSWNSVVPGGGVVVVATSNPRALTSIAFGTVVVRPGLTWLVVAVVTAGDVAWMGAIGSTPLYPTMTPAACCPPANVQFQEPGSPAATVCQETCIPPVPAGVKATK